MIQRNLEYDGYVNNQNKRSKTHEKHQFLGKKKHLKQVVNLKKSSTNT